MNNYAVCILDTDIHYVKAFIKVVAVDHAGFSVGTRSACGEGCADGFDACIGFGSKGGAAGEAGGGAGREARAACAKAFEPACGKYAGAAAILGEARKFILDRAAPLWNTGRQGERGSGLEAAGAFGPEALLCVHAFSGGVGTSCAAIGIGRELTRYRGEKVSYISLEDAEDAGLFPARLSAMRAEEALYRYLRLINTGAGKEGLDRLFGAAFARDEYGLLRLAPDEGAGSLAGLAPDEIYAFLARVTGALGLNRIVLDFGTRLNFLKKFAALLGPEEALFIEIRQEGIPESGSFPRPAGVLFNDEKWLAAAFPVCAEDIRIHDGYTGVGIANAFGLAVKETCDRIAGGAS